MSNGFSTAISSATSVHHGAPTNPAIASAATGTSNLTEKSLELTFCAQFSAELFRNHHFPWEPRVVWFGLTQLQENQLGFDAVSSLGGIAIIFQFKASHTVSKKCGRRFKVEHDQMQILQNSFGDQRGVCFYVFPDVGNINELAAIQADVIGHTWLVDAADLPQPIPLPFKSHENVLRKDNCHYAYLKDPATSPIQFHSEPFSVRAYKATNLFRRVVPIHSLGTAEIVKRLKIVERKSPQRRKRIFRNCLMAVLPNPWW